jgi:hypothetical protein
VLYKDLIDVRAVANGAEKEAEKERSSPRGECARYWIWLQGAQVHLEDITLELSDVCVLSISDIKFQIAYTRANLARIKFNFSNAKGNAHTMKCTTK